MTEERVETMVGIDMLRTHACPSEDLGWPLSEKVFGSCAYAHVASFASYFAHTGKTFVLLHAFVKKTREVPQPEIETATRRMKQYLRR